jgi:hypothetical protein
MHRSIRIPTAAVVLAATGAVAEHPVLPTTFDDFRFIHALVIDDEQSPLYGFHHFYVNQAGASALAKGGPYPTGSVFLGLVYAIDDADGLLNEGRGSGFLMMSKGPEDTDTGGWVFTRFEADGTYVEQDPKTACFDCHTQVSNRDFVFSQPIDIPLPE